MDPVKSDEIPKKRNVELMEQLKELKAQLKKRKEERSLPGAKATDGAPNKLEELRTFVAKVVKKQKAAMRDPYSNRKSPILRLNIQDDPWCTAASPPAFSEDGEGKEAYTSP